MRTLLLGDTWNYGYKNLKKLLGFLIPISFLTIFCISMFIPKNKNIAIGSMEFFVELLLVTNLVSCVFKYKKDKYQSLDIIFLTMSMLSLFIADTVYSIHLIKISDNYGFFADCMYTVFSIFLALFLINKLNLFKRKFNEWGWFFILIFIIDATLSYYYLLSPYYRFSNDSLFWKINAAVYMGFTIFIFSLVLLFTFRVSNRVVFWMLNCILLLMVADYAIRYQDAFIDTYAFSWAEFIWCSALVILTWIFHFPDNIKEIFSTRYFLLSPFISIRSLLTLCIAGANSLLLLGMFCINIYSFNTAVDISSVFFLLFIFWTIANEFAIWLAYDLNCILNNMFKSKKHIFDNGLIQIHLENITNKTPIYEISKILASYNELVCQINKMLDVITQDNRNNSIAEIAFQVSHDIQSPLVALDMVLQDTSEISEEKRILIRSSISRIKDIANNLTYKNIEIIDDNCKSIQLLSSLIDLLVSEKRMQFRSRMNIEIELKLDEKSYGIFSEINTHEFMRVLSNLINNAVESFRDYGRVTVSLAQVDNYSVISIVDNGCGIPDEIINELGVRGKTYGKIGGLGLGLNHAIKTVESWDGCITIDSKIGIGTTVRMMVPLANPQKWLVKKIIITVNSKIIILDDDISIHQVWNERFEKINIRSANVEILHFSTPNQLISWIRNNANESYDRLFLIDYELIGFNQVGLDIIEDLDICSQSILTTSHYNAVELIKRCETLNVSLLPKSMAPYVPLSIEENSCVDAILIDDDLLIHECWKIRAEKSKKAIALFISFEEFLNSERMFLKSTPIYLDVCLAGGTRGDIAAKQIFDMGFYNIYLATGYNPDSIIERSFIKAVVGKYPPF